MNTGVPEGNWIFFFLNPEGFIWRRGGKKKKKSGYRAPHLGARNSRSWEENRDGRGWKCPGMSRNVGESQDFVGRSFSRSEPAEVGGQRNFLQSWGKFLYFLGSRFYPRGLLEIQPRALGRCQWGRILLEAQPGFGISQKLGNFPPEGVFGVIFSLAAFPCSRPFSFPAVFFYSLFILRDAARPCSLSPSWIPKLWIPAALPNSSLCLENPVRCSEQFQRFNKPLLGAVLPPNSASQGDNPN